MTEEDIIKAICSTAQDQTTGLEHLYRYKGAEFKRFFNNKGIPHGSCEDVLQETILKIFNGAKDFRSSGGYSENSANAWMWVIARNCMNDHLKRKNFSKTLEERKKYKETSQLHREKASQESVKDGNKTTYPYIETVHEDVKHRDGSLNDEDWSISHSTEIKDGEFSMLEEESTRRNQLEIDICISNGIEDFCAENPDRGLVLMMQMDGESIDSIARRIQRTDAATKQYISQCKIKLKPFIENCLPLVAA